MGSWHAEQLMASAVPGAVLSAVCDTSPGQMEPFDGPTHFPDASAMIQSGVIDAIVIATPHYSHVPIGIEALKAGLHVLVEKPIAVDKSDAERLIAAHQSDVQIFAAMFNQRTDPHYQKLRELVQDGSLGKIRRIQWTITDWFRTEAYYRSSSWRATWAGEGGGVLLNQCVHNIDLLQWIFGLPVRVRSFCQLGQFHDIEVEDHVAAIFEYADGALATFSASTGEAPGTNRLEIAAENGRVVLENNRLTWDRNEIPANTFSRACEEGYLRPPTWNVDIPMSPHRGDQHLGVLKNFIGAILRGDPLIAPAKEGLHSVELINAILWASLEDRTITLPLDARGYRRILRRLAKPSAFRLADDSARRTWSKNHDFGPSSRSN